MLVVHVEELGGVVVEEAPPVRAVGRPEKRAVQHDAVGFAGLEAEVGGLQRGGVVPGGLRREVDVLLIPELPVSHAVAERGGHAGAEVMDGVEVGGELPKRGRPLWRIMEHP